MGLKFKPSPTGLYVLWFKHLRGNSKTWYTKPRKWGKGMSWNLAAQTYKTYRKHTSLDTWAYRVEPLGYDPNKEK